MFRQINLEDGLPTGDQAMKRLQYEVRMARQQQIRVLKIIHGYGSSGKGGKIRTLVRQELAGMQRRGAVKYFILGENLSIFDENTRKAMDYCHDFRKDADIERHNNGITVAVL